MSSQLQCNVVNHVGQSMAICCTNNKCKMQSIGCGVCALEIHKDHTNQCIQLSTLNDKIQEDKQTFQQFYQQFNTFKNNITKKLYEIDGLITQSIYSKQLWNITDWNQYGTNLRNGIKLKSIEEYDTVVKYTENTIVSELTRMESLLYKPQQTTIISNLFRFDVKQGESILQILNNGLIARSEKPSINSIYVGLVQLVPPLSQIQQDVFTFLLKIVKNVDFIGLEQLNEKGLSCISCSGVIFSKHNPELNNQQQQFKYGSGDIIECMVTKSLSKITFRNQMTNKSCSIDKIPMNQMGIFVQLQSQGEIQIVNQ